MTKDEKVETFIEHFGVLGMKWGVRNKSAKVYLKKAKKTAKADVRTMNKQHNQAIRSDLKNRSIRDKSLIAGAAVGSAFIASRLMGGKLNSPLTVVASSGAAAAGATFMYSRIRK